MAEIKHALWLDCFEKPPWNPSPFLIWMPLEALSTRNEKKWDTNLDLDQCISFPTYSMLSFWLGQNQDDRYPSEYKWHWKFYAFQFPNLIYIKQGISDGNHFRKPHSYNRKLLNL